MVKDVAFTFNPTENNTGVVIGDEKLEEGMSYSSRMLDLNELAKKGIIKGGETINLENYPDVVCIQVATQAQLEMIAPESRKQITAIHLSNNTLFGGSIGESDFINQQQMEGKIDLTGFENLKSLGIHAYVNTDLEKVKLPEGVENIRINRSRVDNLDVTKQFKDIPVKYYAAEIGGLELYQSGMLLNGEDFSLWNFYNQTVEQNRDNAVDIMVDKFGVNARDEDGYTFLMMATINCHEDIFDKLIEKGANVNAVDRQSNSNVLNDALAYFSSQSPDDLPKKRSIALKAIKAGVDVDNVSYDVNDGYEHQIPVIQATIYEWVDVVKAIHEAGGDLYAKDDFGRTAYDVAKRKFHNCHINGWKTDSENIVQYIEEVEMMKGVDTQPNYLQTVKEKLAAQNAENQDKEDCAVETQDKTKPITKNKVSKYDGTYIKPSRQVGD